MPSSHPCSRPPKVAALVTLGKLKSQLSYGVAVAVTELIRPTSPQVVLFSIITTALKGGRFSN